MDEQRQGLIRALSGEPSFDLSPDVTEEFFKKSVRDPLLRTFDQEIAPRIDASFAGQGATFTSNRGRARSEALEDINTQLASELAGAQFSNQRLMAQLSDSAEGRALQAQPLASNFQTLPFQRIGAAQGVLSPFQGFEQSLADARYQEFLRTAGENNPFISSSLSFTAQPHIAAFQQQRGGFGSALGSALGIVGGSALEPIGSGIGSGIAKFLGG
jgi:hypothetical protein